MVAFKQGLWNYNSLFSSSAPCRSSQPVCHTLPDVAAVLFFSASAGERREWETLSAAAKLGCDLAGQSIELLRRSGQAGICTVKRKSYSALHCSFKLVFLCFSAIWQWRDIFCLVTITRAHIDQPGKEGRYITWNPIQQSPGNRKPTRENTWSLPDSCTSIQFEPFGAKAVTVMSGHWISSNVSSLQGALLGKGSQPHSPSKGVSFDLQSFLRLFQEPVPLPGFGYEWQFSCAIETSSNCFPGKLLFPEAQDCDWISLATAWVYTGGGHTWFWQQSFSRGQTGQKI